MALAKPVAAEREAFATIGALGEIELARVKAWIASGCEGEQPRPDDGARPMLTDQLTTAMAAREAAENAASGQYDAAKWLKAAGCHV